MVLQLIRCGFARGKMADRYMARKDLPLDLQRKVRTYCDEQYLLQTTADDKLTCLLLHTQRSHDAGLIYRLPQVYSIQRSGVGRKCCA